MTSYQCGIKSFMESVQNHFVNRTLENKNQWNYDKSTVILSKKNMPLKCYAQNNKRFTCIYISTAKLVHHHSHGHLCEHICSTKKLPYTKTSIWWMALKHKFQYRNFILFNWAPRCSCGHLTFRYELFKWWIPWFDDAILQIIIFYTTLASRERHGASNLRLSLFNTYMFG